MKFVLSAKTLSLLVKSKKKGKSKILSTDISLSYWPYRGERKQKWIGWMPVKFALSAKTLSPLVISRKKKWKNKILYTDISLSYWPYLGERKQKWECLGWQSHSAFDKPFIKLVECLLSLICPQKLYPY